jgi:hypothetical protein
MTARATSLVGESIPASFRSLACEYEATPSRRASRIPTVDVKLLRAGDKERIERTIAIQRQLAPEQSTRLLEIADKTPVTRLLKTGLQILTRTLSSGRPSDT